MRMRILAILLILGALLLSGCISEKNTGSTVSNPTQTDIEQPVKESVIPIVTKTLEKSNGTTISTSATPKATETPSNTNDKRGKLDISIEYKRLPKGMSESDITFDIYQTGEKSNGEINLSVNVNINTKKYFDKISIEFYDKSPRIIAKVNFEKGGKNSYNLLLYNKPATARVYISP